MSASGDNRRQKKRLRLTIRGFVQGVGFRPFIYCLASDMELTGWVSNTAQGVQIEVEGTVERLSQFVRRMETETPPLASIQYRETSFCEPVGYSEFTIRESESLGEKSAPVLPDMSICPDCLSEIFDPDNRRYRYPFTNCTNCGPRFSLIESLPYDRPHTTMKIFPMCDACRAEYEDPRNRRFHAQPNACPHCGPHLELWDRSGKIMALYDGALREAADIIRKGEILGLKGLGGFQLLADAANDDAVRRLRRRKTREEKPLALMYPGLAAARRHCEISDMEQKLLLSPESPIVLLRRRTTVDKTVSNVASSVAPDNPYLGVMLPYTPLHHLLMHDLGFPVVATSGNISDEPICIDEHEAVERLGKIADVFLVHNRPIARQVDDSVVQVIDGQAQVLRNARGYAPTSISLKDPLNGCLAVGAHQKNCAAIARGEQAFVSQHVGDLETPEAYEALDKAVLSLSRLYGFVPEVVACDLHPDYASTRYANGLNLPIKGIQHHYAHVLSCMADNSLDGPVLGVSWDGTGWGPDGTVWGGEFLAVDGKGYSRIAHLRTFSLPGGEKAVWEPRRAALGLLHEIFGHDLFEMKNLCPVKAFDDQQNIVLRQMLEKKVNCPATSSAGRLFDAVASLLDIRQINAYNGQAAMHLGFAAEEGNTEEVYPFSLAKTEETFILDWEAMVRRIIEDLQAKCPRPVIAATFHNTLVEMIISTAQRVGENKIVLTGGCFQNRYLTERTVLRLKQEGFTPYRHHRVPPNDGGIALGQIMAVAAGQKGNQ